MKIRNIFYIGLLFLISTLGFAQEIYLAGNGVTIIVPTKLGKIVYWWNTLQVLIMRQLTLKLMLGIIILLLLV